MSRQDMINGMRKDLQRFFKDLKACYQDIGREMLPLQRKLESDEWGDHSSTLDSIEKDEWRRIRCYGDELARIFTEQKTCDAFIDCVAQAGLKESFLKSDEVFEVIFDDVIGLLEEESCDSENFKHTLSGYFITPPSEQVLEALASVIPPDSGHGTSDDSDLSDDGGDEIAISDVDAPEDVPVTIATQRPVEDRIFRIVNRLKLELNQYMQDHKVSPYGIIRVIRNWFRPKEKKLISQKQADLVRSYIAHCETILSANFEERVASLKYLKHHLGVGLDDIDLDIDAFEAEARSTWLQTVGVSRVDVSAAWRLLLSLVGRSQRDAILGSGQVIIRLNGRVVTTVDMRNDKHGKSIVIDLEKCQFSHEVLAQIAEMPRQIQLAIESAAAVETQHQPRERVVRFADEAVGKSLVVETGVAASERKECYNPAEDLRQRLEKYLNEAVTHASADGSWHMRTKKNRAYSTTAEQQHIVKILQALVGAYEHQNATASDKAVILRMISNIKDVYCRHTKRGQLYDLLSDFVMYNAASMRGDKLEYLSVYVSVALANALKSKDFSGIRSRNRSAYEFIVTEGILVGDHLYREMEACFSKELGEVYASKLAQEAKVKRSFDEAAVKKQDRYDAYVVAKAAMDQAKKALNTAEMAVSKNKSKLTREQQKAHKASHQRQQAGVSRRKAKSLKYRQNQAAQKIKKAQSRIAALSSDDVVMHADSVLATRQAYEVAAQAYQDQVISYEQACREYATRRANYEQAVADRQACKERVGDCLVDISFDLKAFHLSTRLDQRQLQDYGFDIKIKELPKDATFVIPLKQNVRAQEQQVASEAVKRQDRLPVSQAADKTPKLLLDAASFLKDICAEMKARRTTKQYSRLSFFGLFGHKMQTTAAGEKPMSAEEIGANTLYALVATLHLQKCSNMHPKEKVAFLKDVLLQYRNQFRHEVVSGSKLYVYLNSDPLWEALEAAQSPNTVLSDLSKKYVTQTWCSEMQARDMSIDKWPETVTNALSADVIQAVRDKREVDNFNQTYKTYTQSNGLPYKPMPLKEWLEQRKTPPTESTSGLFKVEGASNAKRSARTKDSVVTHGFTREQNREFLKMSSTKMELSSF